MLINDLNTERAAGSMLGKSDFYIEVAKFVQAYRTIVANPNEFLKEVNIPPINEKTQVLKWDQFVKIMQTCDLGFSAGIDEADLLVYYNYALEMGSISGNEKKLATVNDVAEAQKHYYNFVDEITSNAQDEYLKQHKITLARDREASIADGRLSIIQTQKVLCVIALVLGVVFTTFGLASFFFNNSVVGAIGKIIPVWNAQYIGSIILTVLGLVIFSIFNRIYENQRRKYAELKDATEIIFKRNDESFGEELVLKQKLNKLQSDLRVVQAEMNDPAKAHDVKHNIEVLIRENKFYQKYCSDELELIETEEKQSFRPSQSFSEEFSPIKLTHEQEENLRTVSKDAINLEGEFDNDAYNKKFEQSRVKKAEKKQETEKVEETELQEEKLEEENEQNKQAEQQAEQVEEQLQQEEVKQVESEEKEKTAEELAEEEETLKNIKELLGL
ncbi:MAG: hypothetical protein IJ538_03870 [Clostridia bacterium]|nr:hypothetical protein [Clostridia bacterium]